MDEDKRTTSINAMSSTTEKKTTANPVQKSSSESTQGQTRSNYSFINTLPFTMDSRRGS